jgi:hypothetical protein
LTRDAGSTIAQCRPRRPSSRSPHPRSRRALSRRSAKTRWLRNVPPFSPVSRVRPRQGAAMARRNIPALDILFEGYGASINPRAQPSIDADYVSRISSRLNSAAVTDKRFRSPLIVPYDSDCLRLSHGRAHRKRCRQLLTRPARLDGQISTAALAKMKLKSVPCELDHGTRQTFMPSSRCRCGLSRPSSS